MHINCSNICTRILEEAESLLSGVKPCLRVIIACKDLAGYSYLRSLSRIALNLNVSISSDYFDSEEDLLDKIEEANSSDCHGILIMRNSNEDSTVKKFIEAKNIILPEKDVEGTEFADDIGKVSCTARACAEIIKDNIDIDGSDIVIIGYGKVVGKPLAYLLMRMHAGAVTTTHRYTRNLAAHILRADVIVTAVGKSHFLNVDCDENLVIIDAGMSKLGNGIAGDVHPDMAERARVTPVPGGVGPVNSALLLKNVVLAAREEF